MPTPAHARQVLLLDVASRRCSLCGSPFGRPSRSCMRCQLRRDPLPVAAPDPETDRVVAAAAAAATARLDDLRRLGRRIRVALVGCSQRKRHGVHPARTLYTGAFFRRALDVGETTCDESWVLSARHRLVALDRALVTYDEQLSGRRTERAIWGSGVLASLANSYRDLPLHLVFLAGAPYVEGVTGYDQRSDAWVSFNAQHLERLAWTWDTPLRGLDRPARWRWFASQARAARGGRAPPGGSP